ncbi:hypothetical protein LCGC14_1897190 [marine sediment metagenome]|uniref:Uncharacterized protein n=1 Tax=marine sediment metagenome TaxID=412755 RepID=A0A0F9IVR7_9ZZZZ
MIIRFWEQGFFIDEKTPHVIQVLKYFRITNPETAQIGICDNILMEEIFKDSLSPEVNGKYIQNSFYWKIQTIFKHSEFIETLFIYRTMK